MENIQSQENLIWIKSIIKHAILLAFLYAFCIFYLVLWVSISGTLIIPLSLILAYHIFSFFTISCSLKFYPNEKITLADTSLKLCFYTLLIAANIITYPLIYSGIPLFISSVMLSMSSYKNTSNFAISVHMMKIILRWVLSATYLCFSLKVDDIIQWPWIFIFWPIWIIIGICLVFCIIYICFMIVLRFIEHINVYAQIIIASNFIVFQIGLSLLLVGLSKYLSNGQRLIVENSIIFACFLTFQGTLMSIFFNKLVDFFLQGSTQTGEPKTSTRKRVVKTLKNSFLLSRISSTLYKTSDRAVDPKSTENQKSCSNNSIKDCLICCTNACDCVLMPCGHAGLCNECGLKLQETTKQCHICRADIAKVLKISGNEDQVIIATEVELE